MFLFYKFFKKLYMLTTIARGQDPDPQHSKQRFLIQKRTICNGQAGVTPRGPTPRGDGLARIHITVYSGEIDLPAIKLREF